MNDLLKTLGIPEKPVNPQRAVAQKQKELKSIVRAGKRPANPLEQIAYKAPGFKAPSGVSMPKPQPKPVARPYSDPLGMGIASLLQSQPPRVDTQMQAHIRRTQPVTANMGFAVGREESPSIEREMAEYDLRHFGRETYGEQPGDISDSDYAKRTLYRERITKRFGWDSSGRIAQEENLNREIEAHKPENMTPQQRLELVKEAAGGFNPLNVLAGPAAMIPGVHGYLDEGRDALAGKLLGENPNLANLDDAGLALNAINQAMSPVSTAKSVLGRDPRTMTELPDWEQAALTLGDIASQVGLGSLTGGTATGPALSRLGQGALKYLAMDVPGYVQMVRDSGGAENALKQYGGMIRDALDFTKNVPMSQRLQGAALAIAIAMSPAALAKGKVRPDATPPKITEQAPSVPESTPDIRGEVGGVGLDAEPTVRGGEAEPVAGGKSQAGTGRLDPELEGILGKMGQETPKRPGNAVPPGPAQREPRVQKDSSVRGSTEAGRPPSINERRATNTLKKDTGNVEWEGSRADRLKDSQAKGHVFRAYQTEDSARMAEATKWVNSNDPETQRAGREVLKNPPLKTEYAAYSADGDRLFTLTKTEYDNYQGQRESGLPVRQVEPASNRWEEARNARDSFYDSLADKPTPKEWKGTRADWLGHEEREFALREFPDLYERDSVGQVVRRKTSPSPKPAADSAAKPKEAWEMTREEAGVAENPQWDKKGKPLLGSVARWKTLSENHSVRTHIGRVTKSGGKTVLRDLDGREFPLSKSGGAYDVETAVNTEYALKWLLHEKNLNDAMSSGKVPPTEVLRQEYAWGLTAKEYIDKLGGDQASGNTRTYLARHHKSFVQKALSEGKPVPPEVLADYPDLQPKADVPPVKPPKVEAGEPPANPPVQKGAAQKPGKPADIQKPRQVDVKQVADAIGLDLTKERKTVPQIAKAVEDGGYVQSAATSAQKALEGKSLNTEEQVGLAMGLNNIKGQIKGLDAALRKAKKEGNDARALEIIKERDDLVSTHKTMLEGLYKARSESGRSLGAGKFFDLADYAVKEDVISLAEAKVKGEIPEAKRQQLEADSDRYAAMERDLKDAQESIKTSREREAALEKRLADAAIKRAPRAGKTGRIPVDAAKQALKELGAFEPVVGAMPVFSPKQSRAFSTLAKWAIGEVKTAGDVTTDAVVAKMRDLVEKNNVGHVLFDEDYYRAIRQALLGDKSGSYSGLLDDADTWLNQRARQFDETVSADKQSAKVQGDWDKAFKDADKKAEAQARAERLNDIKDAMDATPRNRNAEKLAQGLIKGGNKDFSAIVKAIQGKYKLTDIEAASSARRAVWSMEAGLQRRFGRDLMDASLDVRQKQAELKAIKDEIDYNIEKLSPQSLPTKLRVGLRAFAFSNPVNRVLDVAFNGLRLGAETVGKPVDAVLESAWMLALPKNARRSIAKPQFMATSRRALEASKAIKQGMWADAVQNFKFGDTALLEKQGFPKVGMNSKNEAVNKGFNFLARLPGYTDIPARRTWYEISLLELVDNEVDFMAKQNNWTPTQKSQHRKMMLDNANGELEPLRLAAANAADELVFANTTKFDKIISAVEQGLKKVIGESAGDWVMLGSDVFVTPYLRIFAKITGYGTDHLWGGLKAVTEAGTSKAKTGKVPAHVRRRVIELSRRQMFGLAIGYAATEWYKQAKQSENGKDQLDRYVQLKNGYVDIPEPLKASGVMTPFLLTIGLKRIDDSGGTPAQKDAWRKDLFSSLAIETPLMSGTSDLGRAISLQDDPLKFATRKIANAVIPGAVRQASKMMDREKDSQPWEMRERPVNTKPDTSNSLKTRKDGSTYISEKTWAEQDRLKSTVNELKARIPGLRNQLPTKK